MTWAKLSDDFADHPKVEEISNDAFALYVVALVDCCRRLTDGVISQKHLRLLQTMRGVGDNAVNELLQVELWQMNGDGAFEVHDFLKYNPSRRKENRRKDAHSKQMRDWRDAKRDDSRDSARDEPVTLSPTRPDPTRIPSRHTSSRGKRPTVEESSSDKATLRTAREEMATKGETKREKKRAGSDDDKGHRRKSDARPRGDGEIQLGGAGENGRRPEPAPVPAEELT